MIRYLIISLSLLLGHIPQVSAQEETWVPGAPMPTARESVAACTVDGFIYAIGGFPGGSDRGLTTNERYDPASNTWTTQAPMPTGRRMPVANSVDGKCYLIGGRLTDGPRALDVVEEYDPQNNSWRTRASMPTARFGHSSAVIDDIIYVAGGVSDSSPRGALEAYDPATDSWTTLASMPAPRALSGMAALDGKVYVMGGTIDGISGHYNRLDIYDPVSNTWSAGANMPTIRFSLSAQAVNGRVYAIGGADGPGAVNEVTAYHPQSDTWSTVSPMITRRARFATAALGDLIYAIGGTTSFGDPHVGMNLMEYYTAAGFQPDFVINSGLNDAWYNPLTAGQGLLISVFPEVKQVFLAWFTYDTVRPPETVQATLGESGHRWLTAQGSYSGDTASLVVFVTKGGEFDAAEPTPITDPQGIGVMTIEFADCKQGLVTYELTSPMVSGVIPIQRIALSNVALCENLANR